MNELGTNNPDNKKIAISEELNIIKSESSIKRGKLLDLPFVIWMNSKLKTIIKLLPHSKTPAWYEYANDGQNYADPDYFLKCNRKIYFQDYKHPLYSQQFGKFISNLSVIDLLFNEGPNKSREIIMKNNISKLDLKRIYNI